MIDKSKKNPLYFLQYWFLLGYMKEIKTRLAETDPERCAIFEAKAPAFVKKVLANIKDYEFYVGESMNPEGAVGLLNYREDGNFLFEALFSFLGMTPYFTFFKDGLKIEKL